ncbi:hypothetical protein A4S05_23520 [Nostoc sp. KVJ20]|uniref:hypothetical protein n=1 Tax=Nostoc sp. KVJ20 TaxID=457944 RepID=UPI00083D1154|nr:hypothetical protein [Nostoc sp. KVJ20]ODH02583.1 hypothetical protein A4S05_23520 [Nostoc sp. KVJ20]
MSKKLIKNSILAELKKMEYPGKIYPAREGTISPGLTMYVAEGTDAEQREAIKQKIASYIRTSEEFSDEPKSTDAEIEKEADEWSREIVLTRIDKESLEFAKQIILSKSIKFNK